MNSTKRLPARRGLLRGMATGAGAGLLATPLLGRRQAEAVERRPSVLLLGTTEPASSSAMMGGALPLGLALLVREGFCFDNFRTNYPFRQPTWPELLAGSWNSRRTGNVSPGNASPGNASGRRPTIACVFADRGYNTVLAGSLARSSPPTATEFHSVVGRDGGGSHELAALALQGMAARARLPVFAAVVCDDGQEAIDRLAVALLAGLKETGQGDDLIVVCVPPFRHGDAPFAGHPPLIIHAPGRVAANSRSNVAMNPLDVAPTVCGLAGIPFPGGFPGANYAGLAATRTV